MTVVPQDFLPDNLTRMPLIAPPGTAAPPNSSTVTGDVDIYGVPGGAGEVIGMLSAGTPVTKNCRPDNWCEVPGQGLGLGRLPELGRTNP